MSVSVHGTVVVGVPIRREDCFVVKDNQWVCAEGHMRERSKAKFCERDGTKFVCKPVECATERFAAWAKEHNFDPHKCWGGLLNSDKSAIGIFCVDSVSGDHDTNMALGFRILTSWDCMNGRHLEATSVTLEHVTQCAAVVETIASRLGIASKAEVFLAMRVS